MDLNNLAVLTRMPTWYQELSSEQENLLDNLHTSLREDAHEFFSPRTGKFLDDLGIFPPLSMLKIGTCLQKSEYRPLRFLHNVAKLLKRRTLDKMPGEAYSGNERLIYSSICYFLCPELIDKLDNMLPFKKKLKLWLPEDYEYRTIATTQSKHPYLSVPEILLRDREVNKVHNKRANVRRKPLLKRWNRVSYKQDIINDMITYNIVCDPALNYQYWRGAKAFNILAKKFYELEEERRLLEAKLYPLQKFEAKMLTYSTFEELEEEKRKKPSKKDRAQEVPSFEQTSEKEMPSEWSLTNSVSNASQENTSGTSVVETLSDSKKMKSTTNIESSDSDLSITCSDPDTCGDSRSTSTLADSSPSSHFAYDVSETTFRSQILNLKPRKQLEAAIHFLTLRNENLAILPHLDNLPRLQLWFAMRTPWKKQVHFKLPDLDFFEARLLKGVRAIRFQLPKIGTSRVSMKHLVGEINKVRASFTQQLKLKQIAISRELYPLYNVECLKNVEDRKQFKRTFFAMFPNRNRDIVLKK